MGSSAEALAEQGRWTDVRLLLGAVDPDELGPEEHELLAVASGLTEHDQCEVCWERAHVAWLELGDLRRAARCAFWLGMFLVDRRRQVAPAMGWLQRGLRLVEEADLDCVERWMFQVPTAMQALSRDPATAQSMFEEIADAGSRFSDAEVTALARLGLGQARIRLGDVPAGVTLLDEAMAAVLAGDTQPMAAGIIYCGVILECRRAFDVRRAREWTKALSDWCDRQQGLVPFLGQCLVHRSEVAQLGGDWSAAWDEAEAACDRLADPGGDPLLGMALYQRAELRRLRGEFADAERDYRRAAELGRRAEPGLQLLQLATGNTYEAVTAIRRARADAHGRVQRARILAAFAEIMLAAGHATTARDAVDELSVLADEFTSPVLQATAAHWDAAVLLAEGDLEAALRATTRSEQLWQQVGAPYELACLRLLRADVCEQLEDTATAEVDRSTARSVLESLGATAVLPGRAAGTGEGAPGGLSSREVEVLRLVARGLTNRQVADELVISEKTVARHLSNIFTKIDVSSRAAATAWAFTNGVAAS